MLKLKRAVAGAFCAAFAVEAAAAQEPAAMLTPVQEKTVERLIAAGLADKTAYDVLESLTTEIGPRLAGSDAEARARDWGAAKLKSLGFQNVRVETFDIPYWNRVSERVEIVSPFPQPMAATALGGSVATPDGGVVGEVVRFGTLADLQRAPETGLEGKIVFVDEPMTRTQDGSGYGAAVAKRSFAAIEAGNRGALAAVIRSVGTDSHRNPHTGGMGYRDAKKKVAIVAVSNPDADQLARALKLSDEPVTVRVDVQVETRPAATSGNVIGEIPGASDEIIVVGGHLDSWDLGTGAVDDGAGVAITAAAAKLVGDLRGKPKRTIRLILWGSEETGLHGARAYSKAYADSLDKHVLAAESDFGAGKVWQLQTRFGESALPKAKTMARLLRPLGVGPGDNAAGGGPDVIPLRQAGVPVLSLRQDGSNYFDLHHTPDDTLDKVALEDLQQNVAAWAAMIYMASEMEGGFREEQTAISE